MPEYSVLEYIHRNGQLLPSIARAIDLTLSRPSSGGGTYQDGYPDPALDRFFPEASYQTTKAAFFKMRTKRPTIAYLRGLEGEVVVDRDDVDLTEDTIGSCLIAKGVVWTEADFKLIQEIEGWRNSGRQQAATELLDAYKTTPIRLTDSWKTTLRMLCQRVAVAGKALYTETRTTPNIPFELEYTDAVPAGHLAAPKTGNARWSQLATADGLADLSSHLNLVYRTLHRYPPAIGMGSIEADNLLDQNKVRVKIARFLGRLTNETDPADPSVLPRPTLAEIKAYLQTQTSAATQGGVQAPDLIVSDAIYYARAANGVIDSGTSFIPPGYYFFAWDNYIEAARFPTATNSFANSLAIATDRKTFPPIEEKLAVDGAGVPLVADARYIAACNVQNTPLT
jgi:hypothetical protein